jgi:hypothetical protein
MFLIAANFNSRVKILKNKKKNFLIFLNFFQKILQVHCDAPKLPLKIMIDMQMRCQKLCMIFLKTNQVIKITYKCFI